MIKRKLVVRLVPVVVALLVSGCKVTVTPESPLGQGPQAPGSTSGQALSGPVSAQLPGTPPSPAPAPSPAPSQPGTTPGATQVAGQPKPALS